MTEEELEVRSMLVLGALVIGAILGWAGCVYLGPDDSCPVVGEMAK